MSTQSPKPTKNERVPAEHAAIKLFDQPDRRDLEFEVRPNSRHRLPTLENAAYWQFLTGAINERFFGGQLPETMVTFTHRRTALGYFCSCAFEDGGGRIAHEIAMNPDWFETEGFAETVSTLGHELTHLWRHVHGGRNRKGGFDAPGYHSRVWADKMESIGLMPSDTGKPGGKRTGYRVSDYIIEGGPFDLFCRELEISGVDLLWRTAKPRAPVVGPDGTTAPAAPSEKVKTRFICRGCGERIWGRAKAEVDCRRCKRQMVRS